MKHWLESRQVFDAIAEYQERGIAAALATVVRVRGSAYRHEGAKLVVAADGSRVGNVSGGCLELDVCEVARSVLETGTPERRAYCSGTDLEAAWDLGVGCEGEVEIWIEPVRDGRGAERAALALKRPFHLRTCLDGSLRRELISGDRESAVQLDQAGVEWFVEGFLPPPTLLLCGAGDDAVPLARMATELGFHVVITDRRSGWLAPDRFPKDAELWLANARSSDLVERVDARTYAVVMGHHFTDDGAWLAQLLASPVAYIGMLGPRQRTERLYAQITGGEMSDEPRLHGPVGLDLGTDGAEQVALSILAEIMALRTGRPAHSLREREARIPSDVS